jgi:hypothetical protein
MNNESFVLYKFRAIDKWLIESLVSQSLYFAKPDTLNDPFDCRIDLKRLFKRAELSATDDRKNLFSSFLGNPKFFETWQSTFDNLGVCCFSRENRNTLLNTLLWSHYADAHRGVCLKYQFRASYFLTEEFHLTTMGNVEYLAEPLTEWLKTAPMDVYNFVVELAHKCLKTKSLAWEYEQEARIFRPKHGVFNISEPFLNQVYFGLRIPQADIELITNLARTYAGCNRFSRMVREETEFGFTEKAL